MNVDKERIAKEVTTFLAALCRLDAVALESRWGISPAVIEEAKEALERYSDEGSTQYFEAPVLREIDVHLAGVAHDERAPLRLYELNSGDAIAAECDLWFRGKRSDLTALMDIREREDGHYVIDFRMLEVQ